MEKYSIEHFRSFIQDLSAQLATGNFSVVVETDSGKEFTADVVGYNEEFMNIHVRFHRDDLVKLAPVEKPAPGFFLSNYERETITVWENIPVKTEYVSYTCIKLTA